MSAYCVILRRRPSFNTTDHPRIKRFYVGAPTAEYAIRTASDLHPQFRVMGVEHSDLYHLLQHDFGSLIEQAAIEQAA